MTTLQWHTPEPLWARFGPDTPAAVATADQSRPAILRFASDDFMDQMLATLARDPTGLGRLLAAPESWRSPLPDPPDLIERVPIPRAAATAAHGLARGRPRTAVAPVTSSRAVAEQARTRTLPLKLFQPAHQRYYLVCASLVCAQVGMPDRAVTRGGAEQVGFVLRRLLPADPTTTKADQTAGPLHEYALVKAADQTRWQRVSAADQDAVLVPGEELLPLFPLACSDRAAHRRTLWTGLIPVGRREAYLSAAVDSTGALSLAAAQRASLAPAAAAAPASAKTARLTQFQMEVAEPWKALIRSVFQAEEALAETLAEPEETNQERTARIQALNLQWQMQSWLILLDLADFIDVHLPQVWQAIQDQGASAAALGPASGPGRTPQRALYEWLGQATNPALLAGAIGASPRKTAKATLREALAAIREAGVREGLEGAETLYTEATKDAQDWPSFHFLLAGLDGNQVGGRPDPDASGAFLALDLDHLREVSAADQPVPILISQAGEAQAAKVDRLTALIEAALTPAVETKAPPLPFALKLRDALAATAGDAGWFVVRCVHLDRDCGPLYPPTLSAPTARFQLASFFDPDAPARPVRISLPTDTSPAGLRRHSRGTAFVLSDMLCGQLQRAKGLGLVDLVRSVLPWPLYKKLDLGAGGGCKRGDGIDIGMICSLSIPIVTICALILLIIMVSLLDFIFRWLPYFIFCFPLPRLKGKPETAP